jgi:hypothetical protein
MNRRKEWLLHALCFFRWGPFGLGDHTTCPRCTRQWNEHMAGMRAGLHVDCPMPKAKEKP